MFKKIISYMLLLCVISACGEGTEESQASGPLKTLKEVLPPVAEKKEDIKMAIRNYDKAAIGRYLEKGLRDDDKHPGDILRAVYENDDAELFMYFLPQGV